MRPFAFFAYASGAHSKKCMVPGIWIMRMPGNKQDVFGLGV
jgi:protein involved in ribonucleotide reduction